MIVDNSEYVTQFKIRSDVFYVRIKFLHEVWYKSLVGFAHSSDAILHHMTSVTIPKI